MRIVGQGRLAWRKANGAIPQLTTAACVVATIAENVVQATATAMTIVDAQAIAIIATLVTVLRIMTNVIATKTVGVLALLSTATTLGRI